MTLLILIARLRRARRRLRAAAARPDRRGRRARRGRRCSPTSPRRRRHQLAGRADRPRRRRRLLAVLRPPRARGAARRARPRRGARRRRGDRRPGDRGLGPDRRGRPRPACCSPASSVFTSMALGTIVVVALAVLGSLTVLPAVLALLGDRIDRGRIPLVWPPAPPAPAGDEPRGAWAARGRRRDAPPAGRRWSPPCACSARSPCPRVGMHIANPGSTDLPPSVPGGAGPARRRPGASRARPTSVAAGRHAAASSTAPRPAPGCAGSAHAGARRHRRPGPGRGQRRRATAAPRSWPCRCPIGPRRPPARTPSPTLRDHVAPTRGARRAGRTRRWSPATPRARRRLLARGSTSSTPLVIGVVLVLAFLLLAGGVPLAGAGGDGDRPEPALGAPRPTACWSRSSSTTGPRRLLGFHVRAARSSSWLPLFAFVILFGLSMDYTVLVLERIREERRRGHAAPPRRPAAGVGATAGTVTSAAAGDGRRCSRSSPRLRLLEFKQLGVGLAAAILLDATLVRGVALPAAVTLLGRARAGAPLEHCRATRRSCGRDADAR